MKKIMIMITVICLLQSNGLKADYTQDISGGGSNCNTSIQDRDKNSFLTFFGDSLGDFVDFPYGIIGWDAYLGFYKPDINWRVQNFAIAGWTTDSIYNALKDCLKDSDKRKNFRMSNTIVMEIGGNDMMLMTPLLIAMPWKYWTYQDPLTKKEVKGVVDVIVHNIQVLIYYFRHPLIDKNVLVMGNFPTLAYSPTMGNVSDYFASFSLFSKNEGIFFQKWREISNSLNINVERDDQAQNMKTLSEILKFSLVDSNPWMMQLYAISDLFFGSKFNKALDSIGNDLVSKIYNDPTKNLPNDLERIKDRAPGLYFQWVFTNTKNPSNALSFGLYLMQPKLESMVMEMRDKTRNMVPDVKKKKKTKIYTAHNRKGGNYVDFLPLYELMIRDTDCEKYGYCWVANPLLYGDSMPGHVNAFGYYIWANALSQKLVDLENDNDWKYTNPLGYGNDKPNNDPEHKNDGTIEEPDKDFNLAITPVDEHGNDVQMETVETNIDWLILLCFFFGSCHF